MQARIIASCFALAGFASVVVIGLYVRNPALSVLVKATLVGVVAFVIGAIIGRVVQGTVAGYVDRYKSENPLPGLVDVENAEEAGSDSQNADAPRPVASNG